jgi:hypothetical protein
MLEATIWCPGRRRHCHRLSKKNKFEERARLGSAQKLTEKKGSTRIDLKKKVGGRTLMFFTIFPPFILIGFPLNKNRKHKT